MVCGFYPAFLVLLDMPSTGVPMPEAVGRSSPGGVLMQEPDMMVWVFELVCRRSSRSAKEFLETFCLGRLASAVSVSE